MEEIQKLIPNIEREAERLKDIGLPLWLVQKFRHSHLQIQKFVFFFFFFLQKGMATLRTTEGGKLQVCWMRQKRQTMTFLTALGAAMCAHLPTR